MPKPVISPSQALLLLMDVHKENPEILLQLKQWYLAGIEIKDHATFESYCTALTSYELSSSHEVITNDASRRYFETLLAYRTVEKGIAEIDVATLEAYINTLNNELVAPQSYEPSSLQIRLEGVQRALAGKFIEEDPDLIKEYVNYIARIDNGELFTQLDSASRHKIKLIAQASLLGVANAWCNSSLPLALYGAGIYSNKSKGKVMMAEQITTRNQHMGLMKGHMALPRDDPAYSEKEMPLMKPSDQATYQSGAEWVEYNFNKLVHPYSNSISGTMLCQLRNLAHLKDGDSAQFTSSLEEFVGYARLFTATMLYGSGGHTLHEFSAPLQLDPIHRTFEDVTGGKPITMENLFLEGNEEAFEQALQETRHYQQQMLIRTTLHAQLKAVAAKSRAEVQYFEPLKQNILDMNSQYKARIDSQLFSKLRSGFKKYQLINRACIQALRALEENDPQQAAEIITTLKGDFIQKYGTTVFSGKASKGFEMIEQLESTIQEKLAIEPCIRPSVNKIT